MQSKLFTQILFGLLVLGILPLTAQTPFYTETFSDEASALANWPSGGFNDGTENWKWSMDPAFGGYGINFAAPTAVDGFMVFDSDANGQDLHSVTLTSPAINCSDKSNVFLEMYAQYVYFIWNTNSGDDDIGIISRVELGVSTDGENFTYQDILTDIEPNEVFTAGDRVVVNIPDAIGQETVYLQIRWNGFFEYWLAVDDISLYETEPVLVNDLKIFNHRLPATYATPLSQVDSMFFIAQAENIGADPQTNAHMRVTVLDPNDNVVFQDSSEKTDMLAAAALDTFSVEQGFLPESVGQYFVFNTVAGDEEDDYGANNRKIFNFRITDNLFSVDDGLVQSIAQPAEFNADFWEGGSYFYMPNGEGYEADTARFMVWSADESHIGETATILFYKIVSDDDGDFDDDDLETVGFSSYTFGPEDGNFDLISAPLYQDDGETVGYALEDSSEYLLTITLPQSMYIPFTYRNLVYGFDIGSVVKNGEWFLGGFGSEIAMVVRMGIREMQDVATKEPQLDDSRINAFPNPTKDWYRIDLDLESASPVQLQLMNIAGQTVMQREYTALQRDRIELEVADLPAGAYLVKVRTEEGVKTLKLTKQ